MNGIIEQLVGEMKEIPKLKWKDARKEPPDTTKTLLIMDFFTDDYDEDLPETDDELRTICVFRIAEYSKKQLVWYNMSNDNDVRFDWYIELDILPPKYELDDGLAIMKKEYQEWLDKRTAIMNSQNELTSVYKKFDKKDD